MKPPRPSDGFTLIELIVVVSMLALIAATIFYFLDPLRLIHQTRNERRRKEAVSIASAVNLFHADTDAWPPSLDADPLTWQMVGSAISGCNIACGPLGESIPPESMAAACLDLSSALVEDYIRSIPVDPSIEDFTTILGVSGYAINKDGSSITVRACHTEGQDRNGGGDSPLIEALQ